MSLSLAVCQEENRPDEVDNDGHCTRVAVPLDVEGVFWKDGKFLIFKSEDLTLNSRLHVLPMESNETCRNRGCICRQRQEHSATELTCGRPAACIHARTCASTRK